MAKAKKTATRSTAQKTARKTGNRTRNVQNVQGQGQQMYTLADVIGIAASAALQTLDRAGVKVVGVPAGADLSTVMGSASGGQTQQGNQSQDNTQTAASSNGRRRSTTSKATRSSASATPGQAGRPVVPTSGLQRARVRFAEMHGRPRKEIVASFVNDLKLKKNVANTYFHLISNPEGQKSKNPGSKKAAKKAAAANSGNGQKAATA